MDRLTFMELLALMQHHLEPGSGIDCDRIIEVANALKVAKVKQDKAAMGHAAPHAR